ncbi:hypothetical protein K435DRAFT_865432 [Dendrothele bispora CBS 962.96]|uniref:Uncharacterized protein n=1 Tax=Dendrothele bispora (strain CBS 962.96) TaxID=1314807 RepID=A0A4S8LKW5_DENBC|nr:hypothetical protein K435DRAFT_865432 [Dendrothele bispora CBS 962.96]
MAPLWSHGTTRVPGDSPSHIDFGFPTGSLALTAAALKRALTMWKDGFKPQAEKSDKPAARNGPHSFSQAHWGETVKHYYNKFTSKLSDSKFDEIVAYAEFYLPERFKQLHQQTGIDDDDDLQMSD